MLAVKLLFSALYEVKLYVGISDRLLLSKHKGYVAMDRMLNERIPGAFHVWVLSQRNHESGKVIGCSSFPIFPKDVTQQWHNYTQTEVSSENP